MFELLRNRDFMLFWAASVIASIASLTLQFVISLYAFDLTGSAALFGFILSVVIVPRLILYPIAGVWADRYNRKLMLVVPTVLVCVVLCGFTGWHFLFSGLGVPHLFALVIALEVFDCLFFTVSAVIPPMIVAEKLLGAANSLGVVYTEFGYFFGVLLGAIIYATFGFGFSLLGVTVAFVLCLVFMLLVRLPSLKPDSDASGDADASGVLGALGGAEITVAPSLPTASPASATSVVAATGFFSELREGFRTAVTDELILRLLIFSPVFNLVFFPLWDLVLLFFLRGELGMDVVPFSLFMALQSVTNVIAAIVVAKIYTDEQALRFIRFTPIYLLVCMAFLVTATLIAGLAPLWTVIALSFIGSNLISVAASFYVVGKNTMIQKRVVKERQSRVFSINRVTGLVAMPVGNFIYGLVVEGFGVLAALALTCVGVVCMFAIVRPLRLAMLKKPGEGQGG